MMQQIYFSRFIRSLKRKKFWFMSLLCIIFLIIILVHYYESFRRYAKKMQNELKEAEIRELYILAKNNNDIYHLTDKLIQPDTYNMNNIRPYWDLVGFMFRVPYLMFHYTPNIRSGYITTNDLGYRGEINFSHLPSVQVDKNYRYIVLLGGSAAFGAYSSSDEKCISAVLEKKLNNELKDGKPFKVINLGMGFYNSFQELISYLLYGLKYKPEVVITFDGFNDATVPLIQNKRVPLVSGGYYRIRKLIDGINKKFLKKKEINKLPSIKTKESASWDKESMDYENDVVELYKRNLDLICLISKNKGAKVLLCLQPIKILPDGRFGWEDKTVENIYKMLPAVFKDLASKYRLRYINFQEVFRKNMSFNQYFSNDPVHLSDDGQEIIATYMFYEIKKIIHR